MVIWLQRLFHRRPPPVVRSLSSDKECRTTTRSLSSTSLSRFSVASSTASTPKTPSMTGTGRVFISGSGIGSDSSMIAANNRQAFHSSPSLPSSQKEDTTAMEDEYGEMTSDGHSYQYPGPFSLESGEVLPEATLCYQTYGKLNEKRDNVVVVCHALTGNASLHSWWGDLLGPGAPFDSSKYFVICVNILGSCYGSTSPMSIDPATSKRYGMSFPDISVQDTVKIQLHLLRDHLKIHSIKAVIGGSFGGMQAVEFAVQGGSIGSPFAVDSEEGQAMPFVRSVIPIACGAYHTAWQIGISETQRQAIYADHKWNGGDIDYDDPPLSGLAVARQIGMISYRTAIGYQTKFGRELKAQSSPPYGSKAPWQVKTYLEYQGQKFLSRFDPITYVKLTEQMDTHDVGRNRGGVANALKDVQIPALVLGIDSDVLYPLEEQKELVSYFPNGQLKIIRSDAGHDGFLLEQKQVGQHIIDFLNAHD